ncbi:polyphosphate kinase 1 [Megamonas funiformis]|uniref:polyphosphate kinase 1 n=1 Tax=Megamonas funiformis TaxID=437897 RepID=UPI000E544B96|nr:polyphosphate kinase 1 [Megamonas funiformis]RHG12506.1 polyphosphate kinase 1 [Megamonas funiformis]
MHKKIDTSYTQNRELSWLRFDDRVLEEAIDENVPLYERLKFIAIYASNLDEFYRVRVGSLYEMASVDTNGFDNKSFMTPSQQLDKIFVATKQLNQKADKIFATVEKQLKTYGIERKKVKSLNQKDKTYVKTYFDNQISPFLSPQIINVRHPFPHLLNKALYVGIILTRKKKKVFGIIPVPSNLPKIVYIPNKSKIRYVMTEDIIATYADKIFDGYEVENTAILSVTRSADISLDDERLDLGEDFLEHAREVLLKRQRLAPVRLEIEGNIDSTMMKYATEQFKITSKQIFIYKSPINKSYIFSLGSKFNEEQKNSLMYPPFEPSHICCVPENVSVMDYVANNDVMLQYPYQSFDIFLKFIKEAVTDEKVFAIKITLYRVGSHRAQLMNYLSMAAKMGKDVTVLMELRARFDEENNINWAEFLQDAGCKVIYGMEGYKVHSKICLVMKQDKTGIKYFTQIGTGNYNASTSSLYTDISLITSNEDIGKDAVEFFQNMGIDNLYGEYKNLLVAPVSLKNTLLDLIKEEIEKAKAGEETSIFLKMNSLTDRQLIDALKEASQAGVKIKMIIRGICCILPGIEGKTDNIEVISVVGRFLEHSRIFCFGTGENMKMYIASADWMTRNTENRVEIAAPIYDQKIKNSIYDTLRIMWKDNLKARILCSDGTYKKPEIKEGDELIDCQNYLRHEYKVGRKIKL